MVDPQSDFGLWVRLLLTLITARRSEEHSEDLFHLNLLAIIEYLSTISAGDYVDKPRILAL